VKRLRAFKKINLSAGETQEVVFKMPANRLAFVDVNNDWLLEAGEFQFTIEGQTTAIEVRETKVIQQGGGWSL
ncbi:MAG: fibronectin type III-like domain-contianing protein, partial [Cyclobacteriaceae bacterium]|nr:fibronectin type III-like domain-contianing protein [Cyclobacteriaceae bacterium HetDA_MAG_MS6]